MIVKVCGVSTPEVAEAAVQAGADWIGIVFVPGSPRFVDGPDAEKARHLLHRQRERRHREELVPQPEGVGFDGGGGGNHEGCS